MAEADGPASARVLCVCTANICRSPMTELLLEAGVAARTPEEAATLTVESAGVRARDGYPIAEHAGELLAERGIDPSEFRSREVTPELVAAADLVLCATREHRSALIALEPAARPTAFTIREFAWLLRQAPVPAHPDADLTTRLRELVATARSRRGLEQPDRPEDLDLDDPYGKRRSAFRQTLALLDETLATPLDLLTQQSAGPPVVQATRRSWLRR